MAKRFHVAIALQGVLENAEYLTVVENGRQRRATEQEVFEALQDAKAKGYDVLPPCDNIDEKGHCKGHDIEEGR